MRCAWRAPDVLQFGQGQAELGYTARPYQEALADAIGWFRAQGMIR
jgi:hypothetical protein